MSATTSPLHITPEGEGWAVKLDEAASPTSVHPTRGLAVATAFEMIEDYDGAEVLIHGGDGHIRTVMKTSRFRSAFDSLDTELIDDSDDPAARAEALRLAPSNARLRAGIGKYSLPPGDYDNEEMPC